MPSDTDPRPIDDLVEVVTEENPDPTTRREAFELTLMEEDRVDEGRDVQVDEPDDERE
ncbi:MAG: hypothetical protein ACXVJ7_14505 [Acidimicrobiia bacterium]